MNGAGACGKIVCESQGCPTSLECLQFGSEMVSFYQTEVSVDAWSMPINEEG